MKKIGIVTFWNSQDNYGQLLQCFASIQFFKTLGYDPKLLKVDTHINTTFFHKVMTAFRLLFTPKKLYEDVLNKKLGKKSKSISKSHPREFDDFRDRQIPSTDIIHVSEISQKLPYFDAFITGSDQVWNSLSPYYFLKFAPAGTKKIAYAASMGGFMPLGKDLGTLKDLIKDFSYVSLREKQACNYFVQNEIHAVDCVPDPTLLLTKEDYKCLYEERKVEKPYILLYLLGNKLHFDVAQIYQYAQKKGLDVVYVASQGRIDCYEKQYPTIEEWLNLVEHAEVVVTNSFHGTVFSMIYRKKFMALLLNGIFAKMNDRITDMLEKYGLGNRIFSGGSIEDYVTDVDYTQFEKITNEEKIYVSEKLLNAIG